MYTIRNIVYLFFCIFGSFLLDSDWFRFSISPVRSTFFISLAKRNISREKFKLLLRMLCDISPFRLKPKAVESALKRYKDYKAFLWRLLVTADGNVFITQFTDVPSSSDFNTILHWANFPNSYQRYGYNDDMVVIRQLGSYYALRMQAKFVAPLTGYVSNFNNNIVIIAIIQWNLY